MLAPTVCNSLKSRKTILQQSAQVSIQSWMHAMARNEVFVWHNFGLDDEIVGRTLVSRTLEATGTDMKQLRLDKQRLLAWLKETDETSLSVLKQYLDGKKRQECQLSKGDQFILRGVMTWTVGQLRWEEGIREQDHTHNQEMKLTKQRSDLQRWFPNPVGWFAIVLTN